MAAERISAQEAQAHLESNPDSMLVCAYDSQEKFRKSHINGAISFQEFQARADLFPKDREMIFYCACPQEETSTRRADDCKARGFKNAKVLEGGFKAWKEADNGMALTR